MREGKFSRGKIRNSKHLPARSRFGEGRRNPKQSRMFKIRVSQTRNAIPFENSCLFRVSPAFAEAASRRQVLRISNFCKSMLGHGAYPPTLSISTILIWNPIPSSSQIHRKDFECRGALERLRDDTGLRRWEGPYASFLRSSGH